MSALLKELTARLVYSVRDVTELTGLSTRTVIRLFENEPGVIVLKRAEEKHKRKYRTIKIPRAVFERVIGGLKNR